MKDIFRQQNSGIQDAPATSGTDTEFDERDYLDLHPDVAESVRKGLITAEEHWRRQGRNEGRQGRRSASQLALEAERLHARVEDAATLIGHQPPVPPTLRGSVGAAVLKIVRPLFGWYTYRLREYAGAAQLREMTVLRTLRSLVRQTEDLGLRIRGSEEILFNVRAELKQELASTAASTRAELKQELASITAELAAVRSRIDERQAQPAVPREVAERLRAVESAQTDLRNRFETMLQNVRADGARVNVLRQDLMGFGAELERLQGTVAALAQQVCTAAPEGSKNAHT